MAYTRVNWENSPSTDTPINIDNLNIMDAGIAELDANSISQLSDDLTPQLGGNLDMNGKTINDITPTEIGYLDGLTGNIQSQINQRFRRVFYGDFAGNQNVDTGISANGYNGGRCYLGIITWHTSNATATGTKIFIISCSYDAGTTSNYTVCDIKNSAATLSNAFSTTAGGKISFIQSGPPGAVSYVSLYDLSNR